YAAARAAPRAPARGPRRGGLARVARLHGGERRAGRDGVPRPHSTAVGAGRCGLRAARDATVRRRRRLRRGPFAFPGGRPQGGAAIALGLNFCIAYGGEPSGASGALLTTIVLGVAVAQFAAPPLMALALRTRVASPVAPAPLTPAAAPAELSANATADWPR